MWPVHESFGLRKNCTGTRAVPITPEKAPIEYFPKADPDLGSPSPAARSPAAPSPAATSPSASLEAGAARLTSAPLAYRRRRAAAAGTAEALQDLSPGAAHRAAAQAIVAVARAPPAKAAEATAAAATAPPGKLTRCDGGRALPGSCLSAAPPTGRTIEEGEVGGELRRRALVRTSCRAGAAPFGAAPQ